MDSCFHGREADRGRPGFSAQPHWSEGAGWIKIREGGESGGGSGIALFLTPRQAEELGAACYDFAAREAARLEAVARVRKALNSGPSRSEPAAREEVRQ